ncbi:MAG: hypothetical protein LBR72_06045 [Oscillospiraceae bacterium]|nr:hypothetical protein [Oscillospiraceae bacterium]
MRLYDNAPGGNYEELKTFYPVWYRGVLEMDALWRVFGGQLDDAQAGIVRAIDNCFIRSADEPTVTGLEAFLSIRYTGTRTLNERRTAVAALFSGHNHIGEPEIRQIVGLFTAGVVGVAFGYGVIGVTVDTVAGEPFQIEDCRAVLLKNIPAHLALMMTVIYTTPPAAAPVVIAAGAMSVMETTLPAIPEVPRRAYAVNADTGALAELYTRDERGINRAYIAGGMNA